MVEAGLYEVEPAEGWLRLLPVGGTAAEGILVDAIAVEHEETLETARTFLLPSPDEDPDLAHPMLWLPEGLAYEAVGSYSGVWPRGGATWASQEDVTEERTLTSSVEFDQPIYFRTLENIPALFESGRYLVEAAKGSILMVPAASGDGKPIVIEAEETEMAAAAVLPAPEGNVDLKLLILQRTKGMASVAVGSHSGVFPRSNEVIKGVLNVGGVIAGSHIHNRNLQGEGGHPCSVTTRGISRNLLNRVKKLGEKYKGKLAPCSMPTGALRKSTRVGNQSCRYGHGRLGPWQGVFGALTMGCSKTSRENLIKPLKRVK